MIKFLKYVWAYFCDKEPVKTEVPKTVRKTDYEFNIPNFIGITPLNLINVKNDIKFGGNMLITGGCYDSKPSVIFILKDPKNTNSFGIDLAALFTKYNINLFVQGNIGEQKDNVVTNTAVNYLEQV